MGPRAGVDGWKFSFQPGFDPGPSRPLSVAILTDHRYTSCNLTAVVRYLKVTKQQMTMCQENITVFFRQLLLDGLCKLMEI